MRYWVLGLLLWTACCWSQTEDQQQIEAIFNESLIAGKSYDWLNYLSNRIGGRLSGSVQAEQAVKYTKNQMDSLGFDKVWLQPVMVPKWVRGTPEFAYIESKPGITNNVPITALGGSIATPTGGIKAPVVEVKTIEELASLGRDGIAGKIVFYNRPMQPGPINTFEAYSGAVDQRYKGAMEASQYGAVGIIVRSLTLRLDDLPHTGSMTYGDLPFEQRIPAAAISTNGAELLSTTLKLDPNIRFYFKQSCKRLSDVESHNVIGEIRGSTYPDEILLVGGHLDSWDLGDGAHDDGAGCMQSIEALRLLLATGYSPQRTIRVVLFMSEEIGLAGAKQYAKEVKSKGENHIFALESDAGGFTPLGFSFDCSEANLDRVLSWKPLFEPFLVHNFTTGGSGADIGPLKGENIVLAGLRPDSQRYFDHHHAENDTFEHINKRELELGAAAMSSLLYLFDKYGIAINSKG
ncbi:MAG: M20/M25/M40 family metallo-hydrolase [Flavobacteriaceae bacterium]